VPAPQPPFILADNVYDRINLYPVATLSSLITPIPGREISYMADYRRERTAFQAAAASQFNEVRVDLGIGNSAAVDTCWIDRGHNLWGKTVNIQTSNDPTWVTAIDTRANGFVVPAQGTVGGDPTTGWCVTEEGAIYTLFAITSAQRYLRIFISEVVAAIYTGVILGKRIQLLNYSSVRDEDAGGRTERTTESDAGYQAVERVYAYRTLQLSLDLIGAAEYDASIRSLRSTLFERNQPAFIVMNYGDKPERGWLMQYQGKSWSSPMTRVHRKWSGTFREVGAVIR
jgi:hypothetical protein